MQPSVHVRRASSGRKCLPDVVSLSAAISASEMFGQREDGLGLLQEMAHQLLTPDVVSCDAAISACGNGKQ